MGALNRAAHTTDVENVMNEFQREVSDRIASMSADRNLTALAEAFMQASTNPKYSYNFFWLGRPIIQYPQDIVAVQEIIWEVKPDLIIETGIAHGGSLILSASMLSLLDYCEAAAAGTTLDPMNNRRRVLGLDIDIRPHNRKAIAAHPLAHKITMFEGSSTDPEITARVHAVAASYDRILVCLDSNHTHKHVLAEMEAYAPLVSVGSYCIVFDTIIDDLPSGFFPNRPWGKGDNPHTAVVEYVAAHPEFEIDRTIPDKLLITVAKDGYLKRIH
jgi:cephalosporin hydroxylase